VKGFGRGAAGQGQAGGTLPAATVDGQLLYYDVTTGLWTVSSGPSASGQIPEWNATTGVYDEIPQTLGFLKIGSQGLINATPQFFGPVTYGINGAGSEAGSGAFILPFDCTLDNFFARHINPTVGTAATVSYFVHVEGVNTTLTVGPFATNSGAVQSDLVHSHSYTAGERICIQGVWPTIAVQAVRNTFSVRLLARGPTVL
jgi:hypothetical protein